MSKKEQQLERNGHTHTSLISADEWKTQYTKLQLNGDIPEEAKEMP